ncbi:MAG: hypothetical protein A3G59_01305 [Candidatus Taylorbacteria bacterium RIFCSPLOWO2_12_FULL_47_20]|uniref:Uncharacterized protein n=2 Tax=Candidatus Tayloriibacteriota TaxID=1817919 RepID=A0A1G2P6X7_9BACT|nr:MAG: hypothetical protein A3H68_02895 [Candidatus Taylorbacteria bacterium RIFCSPLOWO2_02_FULL_46_40]OHA44060.1 MAG: hypothetical protein A3G59_01305 [Candidatus Taylorbacteria bacterium RIFCSPLOWO2_12_FULL_47_20]
MKTIGFLASLIFATIAGGQDLEYWLVQGYINNDTFRDVSTFGIWPTWQTQTESATVRTNAGLKTVDIQYFHKELWDPGPNSILTVGEGYVYSEPTMFWLTNLYSVDIFGTLTPPPGKDVLGNTNAMDPNDFRMYYAIGNKIVNGGRSKQTYEFNFTVEARNKDDTHAISIVLGFNAEGGGDMVYKKYKLGPEESKRISPTLKEVQKSADDAGTGAENDKIFVLVYVGQGEP